jgi:hypothetical protein
MLISDTRDIIRTELPNNGYSISKPTLSKDGTGRTELLKSPLMENHKPSE